MSYSERLHIPWWWIVIGLLFVASIAVAVLAYLELWLAISVIALTLVGVGLGLVAYSATRLSVDGEAFTAGRNRLERDYIGEVTALEGEAARQALGPGADNREFLFTRPFIDGLVRVELADPADPHSRWLVSTRRPAELAAALSEIAR
ncbi:DUF3093 domain-containing protein [Tessaracoccus sp. ZS01]|uniref:DUF3093 domain-containing protein n=1 Tax=Tessaracoccus sp. ZS01 TaxID=1906324 RepID=UPI001301561A|nr:DUF3093 domain-containing protein [Tessaracoccus sp. ZS01]